MIDIEYTTTSDYTKLNPPKFIKPNKILNTVLIPRESIKNPIVPTDTVTFIIGNKTIKQKVGLDSGIIQLYNRYYYYFYIVPGLTYQFNNSYSISIENNIVQLNTYFDSSYSAKLINGLLVLPNNFNYAFNHTNYGIILYDNKNILTRIFKQDNKYNYYMANTNNTLLYILNNENTKSLYEINNNFQDIYIRPLYNRNYPLGSCRISSKGVNDCRLLFGNNILKFKNTISIEHLPVGKYNIRFLDKDNNLITINTANNKIINKDTLEINIDQKKFTTTTSSSIVTTAHLDKPALGTSNLIINLKPYKTQFELIGPNNFYRKFYIGYQQLHNILPGEYHIKSKSINDKILVIKNDNNYYSN